MQTLWNLGLSLGTGVCELKEELRYESWCPVAELKGQVVILVIQKRF